MTETLSNSINPLALFDRAFTEHVMKPFLASHFRIRLENAAKERAIITRLDRERARAQYAYDVRFGLLHAA